MMPVRFRKLFPVPAVFCLLWMIMSCGYTFAPQGENIAPDIRNIYVEPFGNKTAQAELENYMRNAFIDQMLQYSRFKIVSDPAQADAVIGGSVLNYFTAAIAYRKNILAAQERATVMLEISFRDVRTGKTIWSSRAITGTVDYTIEDDINLLPASRKNAFNKLTKDTAERAVNLMLSNF